MARLGVWLIVLVGLFLFGWGLLGELGVSPDQLGTAVRDTTGRILGVNPFTTDEARNITVSGNLDLTRLDLSNAPVKSMTLTYRVGDNPLRVNGVNVGSGGESTVTVNNYHGNLMLDFKDVTLEGKASSVSVNGVSLDTGSQSVDVTAERLRVDEVVINEADVRKFRIDEASGTVTLRDRVNIELDDEPLEMDAYLGEIRMGEDITLDGRARRVFVSGTDYKTVVS